MIFELGLTVHGRLTFLYLWGATQGRRCGEGKSKPEMGLQQGSQIRARNGEGQAGSRCGVLKMETKVCRRVGYMVEDFRMSWCCGDAWVRVPMLHRV